MLTFTEESNSFFLLFLLKNVQKNQYPYSTIHNTGVTFVTMCDLHMYIQEIQWKRCGRQPQSGRWNGAQLMDIFEPKLACSTCGSCFRCSPSLVWLSSVTMKKLMFESFLGCFALHPPISRAHSSHNIGHNGTKIGMQHLWVMPQVLTKFGSIIFGNNGVVDL